MQSAKCRVNNEQILIYAKLFIIFHFTFSIFHFLTASLFRFFNATLNLMKRLLASFALFPLIVACSSSSGTIACETEYWDGTFGTCLPANWVAVNKATLRQRGVPSETFVAFQSEVASSGQFPTVSVTREILTDTILPKNYSDASIRSVTTLPEYAQIDVQDLKIDGESVQLHIFSLRPLENEPARRFYQISTVKEKIGYTITATTPLSPPDDLDAQVKFILDGAIFEAPAEE